LLAAFEPAEPAKRMMRVEIPFDAAYTRGVGTKRRVPSFLTSRATILPSTSRPLSRRMSVSSAV